MGCKYSTPHFVLLIYENFLSHPRLGLTVSRTVGNAVVRNKVKRQLKEFFRCHKYLFKNYDYSFIARRSAGRLSSQNVKNELTDLLAKMDL